MRLRGLALLLVFLAGCTFLVDLSGLSDGPPRGTSDDAGAHDATTDDADHADAGRGDDAGSADALGQDSAPVDPCATYDAHMDDPVPDASLATCGSQQNVLILQDPHNCGRCGHDCEGQPCYGGYCGGLTVAGGDPPKQPTAIDDTYIYWVGGYWTIGRSPKDAGGDAELLAWYDGGNSWIIDQALFEPNIAYTRTQSAVTKIVFEPRSVTNISMVPSWGGMAHAGGRLYFSQWASEIDSIKDDDGGDFRMFLPQASAGGFATTRDGAFIFITVGPRTVNDAGVPGALLRVRPDGTDLQQILTIPQPSGLMVDDKYVYWVDDSTNTLNQIPIDAQPGVVPVVIVQHPAGTVGSLVSDATHVYYFATEGTGPAPPSAVYRASKCGGPVAKLLEPLNASSNNGLVLDDQHVYVPQWRGNIYRIPK